MIRPRLLAALLLALLSVPPLWPAVALLRGESRAGGASLFDAAARARLTVLATNTALLTAGVAALAVPVGVGLAVLLERTDLPGRHWWRRLLLLALFVPLPLWLSGWQGPLTSVLALFLDATDDGWLPRAPGLVPAICLHALAALPWVVLIVGHGLSSVEPELEEDALTVRPPGWVLLHVTLPRCRLALAAATLWVAVQTAGEITITDLLQVRTFAEEVDTQLSGPERDLDGDPLGRAVAVSLLAQLLVVPALTLLLARLAARTPAGTTPLRRAPGLSWGRWRGLIGLVVGGLVVTLLLVPVGGLIGRAGWHGAVGRWSFPVLVGELGQATVQDTGLLLRSLLVAAAAGALAATIALLVCWQARTSSWLRGFLLASAALAWATPGPLLGLGLKELFRGLVDWTIPWTPLPARLLWYGPSPLPLLAVDLLRGWPFAVALVWPAMQALPRELLEACRLDGPGPAREWWTVVVPLTAPAAGRAALAVAILSLGELSAGKLVSTPGFEGFAEALWAQMHYGLSADLAARALLLLAAVGMAAALLPSRPRPA